MVGGLSLDKKTIEDVHVKGKKVFCRVDFNVPMEDGKVIDTTRIEAALPTINYLSEQGAVVILASHLGRPKGKVVDELRLDPVAQTLSYLIGREDIITDAVYGSEVDQAISNMAEGDILLNENVRFEPGEEKNDPHLAKAFAQMADIYVNDAFGAAHRAHASTAGVAEKLPAVSGFLMKKELNVLGQALSTPDRPFTAIIGGAKVEDKINVIDRLLDIVDYLLIGGGLAYTFIKALGHNIGDSLLEEDKIDLAKQFMEKAKEKDVQFIVPTDTIVANEFTKDADAKITSISEMPDGWLGLDIGPKTRETFAEI